MFKCRKICLTRNWRNRALFTGQKNKILAASQTVVTGRIAPKICHGQPPTLSSHCSRFHPNRFTFGGVTAERVKAVFCPIEYLRAYRAIAEWPREPIITANRIANLRVWEMIIDIILRTEKTATGYCKIRYILRLTTTRTTINTTTTAAMMPTTDVTCDALPRSSAVFLDCCPLSDCFERASTTYIHAYIHTRSSAIAEWPRDAVCY